MYTTSVSFIIYLFYDQLRKCINNLSSDETSFSMDPTKINGIASKRQKGHRYFEGSGKEM